ncbi:MAG TPA: hypothetical protein PKW63_16640 [Vicinamibacterales bacterium]|nr:hypothetical protein [Vicinamibacterales bacterium]
MNRHKANLIVVLTLAAFASPARAQWTVYDPAVHTQQIIGTAQEIAKFVEIISHQVSQIEQLTEQVNTLHHYVDLFGNPAAMVPESIGVLTADLAKTEVGQTLGELQAAANATTAMLDSANGLYHAVGETFSTPGGEVIHRRVEPYRAIGAVQQTAANFLGVVGDAAARRVSLKNEIAKTTEALKSAQTDAEVQKLTGVLVGLGTALDSTEHEVAQASASAIVQDIANRADAQRQVEAKKEQQHAEFREAVARYGQTFQILNQATRFPTR